MYVGDQLIGVGGDDCKCPTPLTELGSFQFSQMPAMPNGEPSFMAMAYGCLALCPLIAFHSKKPSAGAPVAIGLSKSRQLRDCLGLGIDRFTSLVGSLHQYGINPYRSGSSDT